MGYHILLPVFCSICLTKKNITLLVMLWHGIGKINFYRKCRMGENQMPSDNPHATRPKPVPAYLLHPVYMGDGKGKPDVVIANDTVIVYIGIGWGKWRQ